MLVPSDATLPATFPSAGLLLPSLPDLPVEPSTPSDPLLSNFIGDLLAEVPPKEKRPAAPRPKREPVADLSSFMGELLSESAEEKAQKEKLKELRKQAKNTALPGSTVKRLKEEVYSLDVAQNWVEKADTIWIHNCTCLNCGRSTPTFQGYFRRMYNRHSHVDRWVALDPETVSTLPREMKVEEREVSLCPECLPQVLMEDGWLTAEAPEGTDSDILQEELDEEVTDNVAGSIDNEDNLEELL